MAAVLIFFFFDEVSLVYAGVEHPAMLRTCEVFWAVLMQDSFEMLLNWTPAKTWEKDALFASHKSPRAQKQTQLQFIDSNFM